MEKLDQKATWNFSKFHYLIVFDRKTYNNGHPIFFMKKLKAFQRFFAWLNSLDKFQKMLSRFFSNTLWSDNFLSIILTKFGKNQFLCLLFRFFRKVIVRDEIRTQERRAYWISSLLPWQIGHFNTRGHSQVNWIEPMKIWSKDAMLKIEYCFVQNNETYQRKPLLDRKQNWHLCIKTGKTR